MVNYLLEICFDGNYFNGTQIQTNYSSVQGILTELISKVFNQKVKLIPCSRLDKGVSARMFIVNFIADSEKIAASNLAYVLNRLLPNYIRVKKSKLVKLDFHSRKNAYKKRYEYNIHLGKYDPFNDRFCFVPIFNLDVDKFEQGLKLMEGEHDFSCFFSVDESKLNLYKKIDSCKLVKKKDYLKIKITGHSFGRYQIRYMIGACYLVSIGRLTLDELKDKLDGKNKVHINFKAPASGLILDKVYYKGE